MSLGDWPAAPLDQACSEFQVLNGGFRFAGLNIVWGLYRGIKGKS